MVVLHVGLEMLGEIVDALGEDRHLDFRRTGVSGLLAYVLMTSALRLPVTDIGQLSFLGPALPTSPARLNTRLGTISPRSTSANASNRPAAVT